MGLSGTFASFSLPDLLQLIGTSGKTGMLHITHERTQTRLYFRDGRLIACSTDDPPKLLGQSLLYLGVITEAQLKEGLALQKTTGHRMDRVMVSLGIASEAQVERALAVKAEETVLGLFDLATAGFRFDDGCAPDPGALEVDYDVQDIALRGMKRLDDGKQIAAVFGNRKAVPKKVGQPGDQAAGWDWPKASLFMSIDGKRSVRDLILKVHGTDHLVRKHLFELYESGLVTVDASVPAPAGKNGRNGDQAVGFDREKLNQLHELIVQGRFEDVFDRLDAAFEADPDNAYLRELMVEAEKAFLVAMERDGYSPTKVPIPIRSVADGDHGNLTPDEGHILGLCDGTWDIQSLLWILPMRQFDVVSTIRALEERGILALLDPSDRSLRNGELPRSTGSDVV